MKLLQSPLFNNKIFKIILLRIGFWFPILLLIIFKINDLDFNKIFGNIILALIIIFAANLFTNRKLNLFLESIGVIFFNIVMFIQITHFYLFNDDIMSSTFFIIFESNTSETTEFLSMYIDFTITVIFIVLMVAAFISVFLKVYNSNSKIKLKYSFSALLIIFGLLINNNIRANTFPHLFYTALSNYQHDKKMFNEVTEDKFGGDFSQVRYNSSSKDEISVLIIGESTTRHHMQLYGYYRENNPVLYKIKENLIIFKDIISPHTNTISSLEKVLTLASQEFPDRKFDGSVIQLFNKAGFKTYWLSNQMPMGIFETTTTILSKNCDEQIFVNTTDKSLDNKVLDPLKDILKQENNKKLVIIHLMGTHGEYENRYPASFQKYISQPVTKFNHRNAYEAINNYDNAILYNDFIISEIIKEVEKTKSKSYVLYFSDHGEDVYETIDMSSHSNEKGTKPMYDIPFILWRSEKFKMEENKFIFDTDRKYVTDNLLYTLSDLSSLSFKEFDSTKSLVNKNFVFKQRKISKKKNIDYDILFNSKK
ncbi:sulfatase-like hydrolase/transferase [Kaistella polysaccharea]|uniref:sulfatase-like hydrolase/transferase n=1 Tax=Kaistella polysaccharea TaxID=2878534 RepID=UPI001CF4E480|nr:sulfatase-like hydrolase/transferase [Kaistella polysaccharea]